MPTRKRDGISAVQLLAADPLQSVPLAGLIADQPELAFKELTEAEWATKLDQYLQSPRP